MRFLLTLVFMIATAGLTVVVARATEDDLPLPEETSRTSVGGGGPSTGGDSMFEADTFARALGAVRSEASGGRAATIRIDEEAVQAVVARGAAGRLVVVPVGGSAAGTDIPTAGSAAIRLDEVSPEVPERILDGVRRKTDGKGKVDYIVVQQGFDGELEWFAYLEGGTEGFRGDAQGRGLERID
jgi:hypothetical protein